MMSNTYAALGKKAEAPRLAPGLMRVFRAVLESLRRHETERRAIHAMSAMSDHMLRDLGIGRSQIVTTVRHGRADFD